MRDIFPVVVDGLWRQGAKNLAVRLVSAEGQPLPAWTPGAHIDLHLPCGLIRQYSLTGSPAERDHYLLCIARERSPAVAQAMSTTPCARDSR
jgi:vanillate O-demethylase ferredoxin subunit